MFEVGMSALVLKICSEYAKSLGLNFPPCTQQEINAICEWVDKHTIKDMTISQDGYNVTFTFKTENDTTKQFTFTIPKKVDIDELEKVLKGSDSVVVDRLADNSGLQVRLAQSVLNDINNKLAKPTNPSSDSVVTMAANGTVGTKPLSEIGGGGGGKMYSHMFCITGDNGYLTGVVSTSKGTTYTENELYLFLEELTNHYNSYISFGYASGGFNSNGHVLFTEIVFRSNDSGQKILTGAYVYQLSSEGTIVKTAITNPTFSNDELTDL